MEQTEEVQEMTDDLVKRLRDDRYDGQLAMRISAADRIEELEAVLLEISHAVGDPSAYWIACVAMGKVK